MPRSLYEMFTRVSSWHRLSKVVAWILRYKSNLKKTSEARKRGENIKMDSNTPLIRISVEEMKTAGNEIARVIQLHCFPAELAVLKAEDQKTRRKRSVKKASSIYKLDPIMRDGLLCVGGRLK